MKQVSDKRRAELEDRPAVLSVPEPVERCAEVGAEDQGLQEFVRRLPCAICLKPTIKSEPCHYRARRRFGDWIEREGAVQGNLWPGCSRHHREQHQRGLSSPASAISVNPDDHWKTFEVLHGVNLARVAEVIGDAYLAGHEPETLAGQIGRGRPYETIDLETLVAGIGEF